MTFRKRCCLLASIVLLVLSCCFTAFAYQNSDRKINEVAFTVPGLIPAGTSYKNADLGITVADHANYYFSGLTVLDEGDHWDPGAVATVTLSFRAVDGYYFHITKASQIKMSGDVKYVSAAREDGGYRLVVTVKIPVSTEEVPAEKTGGWEKDGNYWIYRYSDGSLASGWKEIDQEWYYFQPDYRMAVNQWIDNGTYYVGEDGRMLKNAHTPDGYWVDADGRYRSDASASGYFSGYERKLDVNGHSGVVFTVYYNSSYKDPDTGAVFYIDKIETGKDNTSFYISYHTDRADAALPLNYSVSATYRHTPKYENVKNVKKRNELIRKAQKNHIYEYTNEVRRYSTELSGMDKVSEIDVGRNSYESVVFLGPALQ